MDFFSRMRKSLKKKQTNDLESLNPSFPVHSNIDQNIDQIEQALGKAPDLVIKRMVIGSPAKKAAILMLDGMVNKNLAEQGIIKPIIESSDAVLVNLDKIQESSLLSLDIKKSTDLSHIIQSLLMGHVIFLLEGEKKALLINLTGFEIRSIEEPKTEPTVRGSHEGFTEVLAINITLVRRRIINPRLRIEPFSLGKNTKTQVSMLYIKGIADETIVDEVRKRLASINTDEIMDSGAVEQYIEDGSSSLFPTVGNTEKPDRFVAKMLEGRIGILVDGTPMSLTVPYLFIEGLQNSEDYYSRPFYSSLTRMLRFLSFFLSINLPAFSVATQNFHKEMIPTELLASLTAAREEVPFPLMLELVFMLITFEILREAGVRMPRAVGQAISIVGALILGDAAVKAGIVGTPTIIIVAVAGITTFIVTPFADTVTLLRLIMLIPAGIIGLYGFFLGNLALLAHLSSLKSFGIPYFAPIAPVKFRDWRDAFVRLSIKKMDNPPQSIPQQRVLRYKELQDLGKEDQ